MKKIVSFTVDSDIYESFTNLINSMNKEEDNIVENLMESFIEKRSCELKHNNTKIESDINNVYYGKAIQKIPSWALKPEQYNHKIIRAYFTAFELDEDVTVETMENICSDKNYPKLYVPTFKSNYAQMKIDGIKSHGKVFEDNGCNVIIWEPVKYVLMKYKAYFCDLEME